MSQNACPQIERVRRRPDWRVCVGEIYYQSNNNTINIINIITQNVCPQIERVRRRPDWRVADMGCGEALLAQAGTQLLE